MRTVWKFPLRLDEAVMMPRGAEIRCVAEQNTPRSRNVSSAPMIWADGDTDEPMVPRRFERIGTGGAVPPGAVYVATYFEGPYVWHVFEMIADPHAWTEWAGGDEPPADACGKVVEIITEQSGEVLTGPAHVWNWSHVPAISRILRYRIAAEQPEG